jgi:hypothetical protein
MFSVVADVRLRAVGLDFPTWRMFVPFRWSGLQIQTSGTSTGSGGAKIQ